MEWISNLKVGNNTTALSLCLEQLIDPNYLPRCLVLLALFLRYLSQYPQLLHPHQ